MLKIREHQKNLPKSTDQFEIWDELYLPTTNYRYKGRGKNSLSNKAPVFCSASRQAGGRIVTLCNRRLNAEAGQKNKHDWIKYFFHVPKAKKKKPKQQQ